MNSYQNPMIYDIDSDAYELDVPRNFQVTADGTAYEVKVKEIVKENTHVFHCITSYEDYEYVMEQYVKNQMHMFTNQVKVLLLYYDEQLGLHATMPVRVSVEAIVNEASGTDASYKVNRRVKPFMEWQSA